VNVWTTSGVRKVGTFYFLIALFTLVVCLIQQPVGEWSMFAMILGIALAIMALAGLYMAFTGKGMVSRRQRSLARQRKLTLVALGLVSVLLVLSILSDFTNWSVTDTMTVGIWVAVGGVLAAQAVVLNRAITQSGN
jgi:membrane associated rhomboid family serine protease